MSFLGHNAEQISSLERVRVGLARNMSMSCCCMGVSIRSARDGSSVTSVARTILPFASMKASKIRPRKKDAMGHAMPA